MPRPIIASVENEIMSWARLVAAAVPLCTASTSCLTPTSLPDDRLRGSSRVSWLNSAESSSLARCVVDHAASIGCSGVSFAVAARCCLCSLYRRGFDTDVLRERLFGGCPGVGDRLGDHFTEYLVRAAHLDELLLALVDGLDALL